jgi:serine/threonine-protein kinase RsbW
MDPFALTLNADPAELAAMRCRFGRWLHDAEIDAGICPALILAVHEAAANAIEHSAGDRVGVDARIDRSSLVIEISDSGPWPADARSSPDRGRGILLIEALVEQVEFERDGLGTVVRIRQPV